MTITNPFDFAHELSDEYDQGYAAGSVQGYENGYTQGQTDAANSVSDPSHGNDTAGVLASGN